jgi:hypothetical protein
VPNINEQLVTVIEGFITKEEAEILKEEILSRCGPDPRDNYRTYGIDSFEMLTRDKGFPWDANDTLRQVGLYAYNFFKKHYDLDESFILDRAFGNIMDKGAYLDSHMDFSYSAEHAHDPNKKTFVCGLFLNDDYDGGNFTFYEGDLISFKPRQGTIVLFNGHSTRHGVQEILENTRVNVLYMFYYTDPELVTD